MTDAAIQTVELDVSIARGTERIDRVHIRKPSAGELRGLSMLAVAQMDINAMIKLLPRITGPALTEAEVAAMDLSDFMSCAAEVAGFLPTRAQREEFPET